MKPQRSIVHAPGTTAILTPPQPVSVENSVGCSPDLACRYATCAASPVLLPLAAAYGVVVGIFNGSMEALSKVYKKEEPRKKECCGICVGLSCCPCVCTVGMVAGGVSGVGEGVLAVLKYIKNGQLWNRQVVPRENKSTQTENEIENIV